MSEQKIIKIDSNYNQLGEFLAQSKAKRIMLVCGQSFRQLNIAEYLDKLALTGQVELIPFSEFQPNPLYESVEQGVKIFQDEGCDAILAVGGGSAMDVAKCIKLYCNMDAGGNYLVQEIVPNHVPLWAMPTTAGSGSEATRYAVIYDKGEKQSITDISCIPSIVFMDASVLHTLPLYQKKAAMLDAMCHAIESCWSINATKKSQGLSRQALLLILKYMDGYLDDSTECNENMLIAANLAGQAINITQTTAGHAMSYKLTSLYHIAHGHAAALCVPVIWRYMLEHVEDSVLPHGELERRFTELAEIMGCSSAKEAVKVFANLVERLGLFPPKLHAKKDLEELATSVNPVRLKNNPISLNQDVLRGMYEQLFDINDMM